MNDDEFPDIIGSGTEHHVSVSERTGNAKTPQNHVSSHEEETEALKRNFEAQAHAALTTKRTGLHFYHIIIHFIYLFLILFCSCFLCIFYFLFMICGILIDT